MRVSIEGRSFADRYVCMDGVQEFSHTLRRIGARYLELHIIGNATVENAGIIPVVYPLPEVSPVKTDDRELAHLNELSVNTLLACMHEHYEDCPWREQALYACDSRNQMLFGYQLWGNYQFANASLDLLAQSLRSDGHLELCAPAKVPVTIPVFSFAWIVAVKEYVLYSGDLSATKRYSSICRTILNAALRRKSKVAGLFEPLKNDEMWNFYEWSNELSRSSADTPDSLYNLYLLEALRAENILAQWGNFSPVINDEEIQNLGREIECEFWDEVSGCYLFRRKQDQEKQSIYEHIQILMLYSGLVPAEKRSKVEQRLLSNDIVHVTYSVLPYWIRAMMNSDRLCQNVLPKLKEMFSKNLHSDSSTLWEHPDGADWIPAASLCHAWSAASVYYSGAYLLGVTPLKPGFKEFLVKPYPGTVKHAKGEIPTPAGMIKIEWTCIENAIELQVHAPAGLKWETAFYPGYSIRMK